LEVLKGYAGLEKFWIFFKSNLLPLGGNRKRRKRFEAAEFSQPIGPASDV
jgi:hypothetical protein